MIRNTDLKEKLINVLMENGNKKTGEKILLKSFKFLQKITTKNHKQLIQTSFLNTLPVFKINKQRRRKKKGKKKPAWDVYTFLKKTQVRTILSMRSIKTSSQNSNSYKYFYQKFAAEILLIANNQSQSIKKKEDVHKKILMNKKYLKYFKW